MHLMSYRISVALGLIAGAVAHAGLFGPGLSTGTPVSLDLTFHNSGFAGAVKFNGVNKTFGTGPFDVDVITPSGFIDDYIVFCFELEEPASAPFTGYTYYEGSDLLLTDSVLGGAGAATKLSNLHKLFSNYYKGDALSDWNLGTTDGKAYAAAFQIAIWELSYDASISTTGGIFRVRGATDDLVEAKVAEFLAGLTTKPATGQLFGFISPDKQNQIGWTPVPEPSSALAGLTGMAVAMLLLRRRRC